MNAPCPICGLTDGFHLNRVDYPNGPHGAVEVPRHLVRPSNGELRRIRRAVVAEVLSIRGQWYDPNSRG